MEMVQWIEAVSVILNMVFVVLMMRASIWSWLFGIAGSALGVWLFLSESVRLDAEALLYVYYVIIGVYGWWRWSPGANDSEVVVRFGTLKERIAIAAIGFLCWPALSWVLVVFRDSAMPWLDAFTTVFSFLAAYMQAEKMVESWWIWIVVNALSIALYYSRGLELYALLAVVYFIVSVAGLLSWNKRITAGA